jgi:hypothetical protein
MPYEQKVLSSKDIASPTKCPHIALNHKFHLHAIDAKLGNQRGTDDIEQKPTEWLGSTLLSAFKGTFVGPGLNTIFRPNSDPPTTTEFENEVTPPPPHGASGNVLELNLMIETLAFSGSIGAVPNRGLQRQNDIILNGITYLQTVVDVTNTMTGKADGCPTDTHIEPGLWIAVPATTHPKLGPSIARLGSIPHGTTINAQCLSSTSSITYGPPDMSPVGITPFRIGRPEDKIHFISQNAANPNTPRIPQDLELFIKEGTITQAILDDPVVVLREAIKGQNIIKTVTFEVSTEPISPVSAGGVANIDFLQGSGGIEGRPNANAVKLTSTFWIETVQHRLVVPRHRVGEVRYLLKTKTSC